MRYTRIFTGLLAILSISSCAIDNLECSISDINSQGDVTVVGRFTRFDDYEVNTRAPKDDNEVKLTSFAMAIFEVEETEGNKSIGNCVHYEFNENQNQLLFTLDRNKEDGSSRYEPNKPHVIYVFANMPNLKNFVGGTPTLDDLLSESIEVNSLDIPEKGFPMIGSIGDNFSTSIDSDNQVFILSPIDNSGKLLKPTVNGAETSTLNIPLKALYAKMNFTIEVRPDQVIEGFAPMFELRSYVLNNVPATLDFKKSVNTLETKELVPVYNGAIEVNHTETASGANKIEFSFYLPENLLQPATSADEYEYPFKKAPGTYDKNIDKDQDGIRNEDEKYCQRYKVKLLNDPNDANNKKLLNQATNIVLKGQFKDHQTHTVDIEYTIYLGKDNFSDFNIVRNGEYNNDITIRGILNSKDNEENYISLDHRVNIKHKEPAVVSLRREVLLDSHFEIRPLRVKKNTKFTGNIQPTHVKIEVVNPTREPGETEAPTDWMRLEQSFGDGTPEDSPQTEVDNQVVSIYLDEDIESPSYGKRRFFTYNLINGVNATAVDATLKNSTEVILPLTEKGECCWIYVDECTKAGDGVRSGVVKLTYLKLNQDGGYDTVNNEDYPEVNYTINQRKLFRVTGPSGRTYNIEYEEEYLHNFDSEESFGKTEYEGMPWGLENQQLSHQFPAVYVDLTGGLLSWLDEIGWDFDEMMNGIIASAKPYYDFYLTRDKEDLSLPEDTDYDDDMADGVIIRDYSGYEFSRDIIQVMNGYKDINTDENDNIDVLNLSEKAKSAVEYCYNKNKRDANGHVVAEQNTDNFVWYLPAVDEIEEIVMSEYKDSDNNTRKTYIEFEDFQAKMYWSSQPAYIFNNLKTSLYVWFFGKQHLGTSEGKLFIDNTGDVLAGNPGYARATSVSYEQNQTGTYDYFEVKSGISGASNNVYLEYYSGLKEPVYTPISPAPSTYGGYLKRTDMARVRCARIPVGVTE